MDKVQSFINAVDAVLRSGAQQAAMRAQTGKLFVDFVTDLRSQLDLHSHADRRHHAGYVVMKVVINSEGIDDRCRSKKLFATIRRRTSSKTGRQGREMGWLC